MEDVMKSKVTLKELVGTKIIYALLLACYYWMWARQDWHDWYLSVQYAIAGFTVLFFVIQADRIRRYSKEEKDPPGPHSACRTGGRRARR